MKKDLSQAMLELIDKECEKAVIGALIVPKTKRSIYRTCLEWLKRDKK